MGKYLIQITYNVTDQGGFQNLKEAYEFIAAYVTKNAETDYKPNIIALGYDQMTFKFIKEFSSHTELILWVQKTEELLDKFLEDHKNDIQKTPIRRTGHSIFREVTKRFLFWKWEVWKEI